MKTLLLLFTLLFPLSALAQGPQLLEQAAAAMNDQQPDLQSYRAAVETAQVDIMLSRMTANMPANLTRPQVPQLFKYWDRQLQASLVRAEGAQVFPYMQEMIARFSSNFSVELHDAFLPLGRASARSELLGQAELREYQGSADGEVLTELELSFATPTDLGGAFYRDLLGLPQQGISRLLLAFDGRQLLRRLDITRDTGPTWSLSLGFEQQGALQLPVSLHLRGDQGQRETRVATRFAEQQGFWLPVEQVQSLRQGEQQEERRVQFRDYQVNSPLPPEVLQSMQKP